MTMDSVPASFLLKADVADEKYSLNGGAAADITTEDTGTALTLSDE